MLTCSCDQNTVPFYSLDFFACNFTILFLIPMIKKRDNSYLFTLYQITVLLPKYRNMQKAGFLMTWLKIMLAVHITEG